MTKVNLDKIHARAYGNIESVQSETEVLPNGVLVSLGGLLDGERELREAVEPDAEKEQVLVASVELTASDDTDNLDYETPAGQPARAFHLSAGDQVQVEQALFAATPSVGDVVTGGANYQYVDADDSAVTKFEVLALTKFGFDRRDMALLLKL